jgi:hypothetical protein
MQSNAVYQCDLLRENRQTELVMIYGQALVELAFVGIFAFLTGPRIRYVELVKPSTSSGSSDQ